MTRAIAIGLCLALAAPLASVPAWAQSSTASTADQDQSRTTAQFVQNAAMSDLYEIQSAELALNKATDEPTKAFARQMIKDHTKTSSDIKAMVQSGKVDASPPAALDDKHQRKLDRLKAMEPAQFTQEYHREQVIAHQDAVAMFGQYAKDGDNATLKAWAARTLPTLKHHLDMAQKLAGKS